MEELPLYDDASRKAPTLTEYARRMLRFQHMDFEYTTWQMLYLCVNPRRIYRTTTYHARTKHQWARDDPAFVVVLLYLLAVASVAWCLAFGFSGGETTATVLYVLLVDFLAVGAVLASVGWWLSNTYLNETTAGTTEWSSGTGGGQQAESVEWRYAFDVHCNSFVPLFLLLYVLQFLLLPLLLQPGFVSTLLSNSLYGGAFSVYHYIAFLGYSELPFLRRTEFFVYPIGLVCLAYLLLLLLGWNCTAIAVNSYFGE